MSDYYPGLSQLLLLLGGGTGKEDMRQSFLWSLLSLHHLKNRLMQIFTL